MPDQFRTTVSAVFWTASGDDATPIVDAITAQLPELDQDATLATVQYVPEGRPEPPPELEAVESNGAA